MVALILFNLPARTTSRLKLSLSGIFLPLFGLASSTQKATEAAGLRVLPKSTLAAEVEKLRHENAELQLKLTQREEAVRENDLLRKALSWQQRAPWKVRLARVITRDPANWWRTVQIDVGSNQGIRINLPVLTSEGLVGRIAAVAANRSLVLLLGDPNLRVGALIQEKEVRENGIVQSSGNPIGGMVEFQFFSHNSAIKPGQNVISSGDGGVFPKGILIGQIVDIGENSAGLSTQARVKLAANLNSLEEVWVMFP